MITIIPAGKGGSTPTPTPGQQLKIVSNDDSIKVFENDADETERNIERYNFLAAEDIDNGASCYFNFVEEDNAGAGAKNLVEYVINTKEGRKINFSMICPYSPTSLDDFTIKITGDVLEDDGFYIELYSDPGDGDGNRYQGYFGVIWFYSASFAASGGDPDQQFFIQVAGDKTNVNWQWLGLTIEAYQRLQLLEDAGYYMRDFWEGGEEQNFILPKEEKIGSSIRIDYDKFNLLKLSISEETINIDNSIENQIALGLILFNEEILPADFANYSSCIALYGAYLGEIKECAKFAADEKIIYTDAKNLGIVYVSVSAECDIQYTTGPYFNTLHLDLIQDNEVRIDPNFPFLIGKLLNNTRDICAAYNDNITYIRFRLEVNLYYREAFYNMNNLIAVYDAPPVKVSNISTDSYRMFYNCPKLKNVQLTDFDFSNVTDMNNTFEDLPLLESIVFGGCDLSHVVNYTNMIINCPSLQFINAVNCNQATIDILTAAAPAGVSVIH